VILLDTCVISELAKPAPDPAVLAWIDGVRDDALWLSVLTLGEIKKGADLLDAGSRKDRVDAWLSDLRATFGDRVLPVDEAVALQWGAISAAGRRSGRIRPAIDSLLAATAICHDLKLATRNVADFEGTGVVVVNPWDGMRG
jgi:predicted nucleic acid-binding protein